LIAGAKVPKVALLPDLREKKLMAYKVIVGGIPIECDSADEALEIANRLGGAAQSAGSKQQKQPNPQPAGGPQVSRWTESRVDEFLKTIKQQQRRLIDVLLENAEDGRTDAQLCQALNLAGGNMALGGVLTALKKNAKKVGADPEDLYTKTQFNTGGANGFEYFITESFRKAAAKHQGT
jgi:hypothetical protein